ncbi:hypothetical protein KY328_01060 [Candidatus Woesearchaeota archaeon]|nr:hypothetical protein [Candidatus Woesearchaeota archaeon]MBW3021486.1 hypothetical protein [Candidatus Woesearchaeota archaeon]
MPEFKPGDIGYVTRGNNLIWGKVYEKDGTQYLKSSENGWTGDLPVTEETRKVLDPSNMYILFDSIKRDLKQQSL